MWEKALLGRQPSCRYFPPLWRKAHSALGGAIIAPAPPAIGRYAIYTKNQDKSNRCSLMQRVPAWSDSLTPPKIAGRGRASQPISSWNRWLAPRTFSIYSTRAQADTAVRLAPLTVADFEDPTRPALARSLSGGFCCVSCRRDHFSC